MVTRNPEDALRRLRRRDGEVYIWVDAICINQADLTERSEHIIYMHHVYQCAERVLVWLGEAYDDSDSAIDQLEILGCDTSRTDAADFQSGARRVHGALNEKTLVGPASRVLEDHGGPVCGRCKRVVWASEILVICGSREISWDTLFTAYAKIRQAAFGMKVQDTILLNLALSSTVCLLFLYRHLRQESSPISLEHTLTHVRARCSTDPN